MISHTHLRRILPITGLACGSLICSNAIAGSPTLDVMVYSGLNNSPPNFPGLYWNLGAGSFTNPVIDESGKIAFVGTLFGKGITPANNRVMWYGDEMGWTVVARNGEPTLPSLPGLTFAALSNNYPAISPNGNILVSSTLAGPGVVAANDTACWNGPVGSHGLVARESTTVAPNTGSPGAVLSTTMSLPGSSVRANNAGQVLFSSNLTGGTPAVTAANNFGVYLGSSSGIIEVSRKGNPIPGAPALPDPSGPFMTPDSFGLLLNGAGEVVSTGTLVAGTAGGVTANDDKVVYTTVGGSMRLVARENDPVPGLTDVKYKPTSFFSVATLGITNSGKVVFNPTLDNIAPGTSVTAANDTCWLVDDHGAVSMLIREGDAIDGDTFNFVQTAGGMFLTNNDRVVMAGSAVGATGGRMWTGPLGGPYTKIVQQAVTTVPGDPTVILDFQGSSSNVAVNGVGQIVFTSNLTGPGVTPGLNDRGVFSWDQATGLVMLGRNGSMLVPELLEVSQLTLIGATGFNGENSSPTLTDNGWLTFRLQDVKGFQAIVRTRPFDVEPCPADLTGDGDVNMDDLLFVIAHWSETGGPADLDGNGTVGINDLLLAIAAYGACP